MSKKILAAAEQRQISLGRHATYCKVCKSGKRAEIEEEWLNWGNTTRIAKRYSVSTDSIYRHATAMGLFEKRSRNIRKALERMIEQAEKVEVTGTTVVSAIQAYAKINTRGEWIERQEIVDLNDLFERMTESELEAYVKEAKIPDWFSQLVGAAPAASPNGDGGS